MYIRVSTRVSSNGLHQTGNLCKRESDEAHDRSSNLPGLVSLMQLALSPSLTPLTNRKSFTSKSEKRLFSPNKTSFKVTFGQKQFNLGVNLLQLVPPAEWNADVGLSTQLDAAKIARCTNPRTSFVSLKIVTR